MGMPLLTAPGSPQQAYTTQLPSYPAGSPGGAGSRVYATTLPATYAPSAAGSVRLSSPPVVNASPAYTTTYLPQG